MRLAWLTDPHLNFLDERALERFLDALERTAFDALLVSGDVGEADDVEALLARTADRVRRPVHFVLGNHDYYGGRIAEVRARIRALAEGSPWLRWLSAAGVVALTETTALLGHDGWADGRLGHGERSGMVIADYVRIADFADLLGDRIARVRVGSRRFQKAFFAVQDRRFALLRALADEAAAHVRATLPAALDRFRHVVVVTHVPPFREACWHEGRVSDDEALPHFASAAFGEALVEAMASRPDRRATVLCGHTHGAGTADLLPNLRVVTGGATYGAPELQPPLDVE